jgi:hypothetical protein
MSQTSAAAAEKIVALCAAMAALAWGLPSSGRALAVSAAGLIALGRTQPEANKPLTVRFAKAVEKIRKALPDKDVAIQIDALLSRSQFNLTADTTRLIEIVKAGRTPSESIADLVPTIAEA